MKRIIPFLLLLCIASPCFAEARYANKKEMVQEAEAIAVVNITKVEDAETKGKVWTYCQKASGTVERVLKGDLKKEEKIEICGEETFICAQCRYEKGRFLLFLRKDGNLWVGSNWHVGIRPIKKKNVEWFKDGEDRFKGHEKSLEDVVTEIATIDQADQRAGLEELLPKFKAAWNSGEVEKSIALFHPDCPMMKKYKAKKKNKADFEEAFSGIVEMCGKVTNTEIRKYIARKNRFVVRATYEKGGMVPGTFSVKKAKVEGESKPKWLIFDFNINGHREPELKE